ncbi:phosphatase PAP2 family protein [Sediminibacterium soli]|uniref:phosphatase PAP2 family protein n=1 Tax=Sediminibacterium soli TaxID=2698829 RepID=UPI00137953BA|nr:phosphatase PAP2 family protein [Sediminibacterium soli]NCI47998.1 phosphatase PAP2 family protein [Sediminibacterium soli]
MRNSIAVLLCTLLCTYQVFSQSDSSRKDTTVKSRLYNMRPAYQLPIAGAAIIGSTMAFRALDERARLTPSEAMKLNPNDVNAFDRSSALRDPANFKKDASVGDFFLNFSVASPALLALDKHMRRDWVDLLTLYLAAHAVDNMLYFSSILAVKRPRPLAYNAGLDSIARSGVGMQKSFFSGHVSFAATATFFAVKTYTDYHNIKGWKRIGLYALASIPPLVTGYYRERSGRHFKTDIIAGFIAGASSGILVPEMFKRRNKDKIVALTPYYRNNGAGASLTVGLNTGRKKQKDWTFLAKNISQTDTAAQNAVPK